MRKSLGRLQRRYHLAGTCAQVLFALTVFGGIAMRHWHQQFDEIEAAYQKAFPGVSAPVGAPEVSDHEILRMGGDIPHDMQDPELRRAQQLGQLNQDGAPTQLGGTFGSQVTVAVSDGTGVPIGAWAQGTDASGLGLLFGNPKAILQLQGPDDKAEIISVVLTPPQPNYGPVGANRTFAPCAIIEFGIGGVQSRAEVDWIDGQVIQIPASFLRLSARLDPLNAQPLAIPDPNVALGANVGKLPKTRVTPLQKSFSIPSAAPLAHGASQTCRIPPFATSARFNYFRGAVLPVAPSKVEILVLDAFENVMYDQTLDNTDTVPLAGGATFVQIFNNDAGNSLFGSLIFTIEL
jgi:hypothetical protein